MVVCSFARLLTRQTLYTLTLNTATVRGETPATRKTQAETTIASEIRAAGIVCHVDCSPKGLIFGHVVLAGTDLVTAAASKFSDTDTVNDDG